MNIVPAELPEPARIAIAAAQELQNGETCFVGIGIPSDAACFAKLTHAPELTLVYESGVIGALPPSPPLSTGSPSVQAGAAMVTDALTVFADLQAGHIDVGLLSAAQIDRHGNLNSTVIGPYDAPKLRLVGSGGAHDIACLARRTVIIMPHEPRRFVEAVDFITSPGAHVASRSTLSLGAGPCVLVTSRARFVMEDGEWRLAQTYAGFTDADAMEGLPWDSARAKSYTASLFFTDDAVEKLAHLPHLHPDRLS